MRHPPPAARARAESRAERLLGVLVAFALAAPPLAAEPVSLDHNGLRLNGEFLQTVGAHAGPVVLIVHGTLMHHRMTLIADLQKRLAERGFGSLAITLGLSIDNRTGIYDCATPHMHRHTDALDEIDGWLMWLRARGVGSIALLGHSRGGNQVARFAAERPRAIPQARSPASCSRCRGRARVGLIHAANRRRSSACSQALRSAT